METMEWLKEQLKALPVGWTWKDETGDVHPSHRAQGYLGVSAHAPCGCKHHRWLVHEDRDVSYTVTRLVDHILQACPHGITIDSSGSAVLPEPSTEPHGVECPECGVVLFRPCGYEGGSPMWQQDEEKRCPECLTWSRLECDEYDGVWATQVHEGAPRVTRPYDEGGTNPIGLPVLPKPAPVVAAVVVDPEGPQPGDVVRWEAYVGESDGSPIYVQHEGLVVKRTPAGPSWCLHARRKVDGETVVTTVAVERCVVVKKAREL